MKHVHPLSLSKILCSVSPRKDEMWLPRTSQGVLNHGYLEIYGVIQSEMHIYMHFMVFLLSDLLGCYDSYVT